MNNETQQALANYSQFLKTSGRQNPTSQELINIIDNILDYQQNEEFVREHLCKLKSILKPYKEDEYIKKLVGLIDEDAMTSPKNRSGKNKHGKHLPIIKNIFLILLLGLLAACTTVKQIGKVNMISNRNVDPSLKYQVITTYSGGSQAELKQSRSDTIEDAIDKTVRKVPGGNFLMNATIFLINSKYFAIEGDVWGDQTNLTYRGFKVGDKVIFKNRSILARLGIGERYLTATILALRDDKTCIIKFDDGDKKIEAFYDDITKTE